jgi:hypothetical protein
VQRVVEPYVHCATLLLDAEVGSVFPSS